MSQDNPNQPIIVERQPSTDPSAQTAVDAVSEMDSPETQVAEAATTEEEEENTAGQEEEKVEPEDHDEDDDSAESECASSVESSESATTPSNSTTPATQEEERDERSELAKQPYNFDHCTVQIAIQLLPADGDPNGRMVVVGVRSHLDTPILRFVRVNELGTLPPIVNALLDELKAELPVREQAAREAFEKKEAEKAKRQATVTASKTTRGKKSKATLSSAPASSTATADNRPRPEVKVSSAPQQQMGLF